MIQRLDELTSPVEVGKHYLVPTVTAEWFGTVRAWPVIGPQHNDTQCLDFKIQHYHLDARFLLKFDEDDSFYWGSAFASPLQTHDGNIGIARKLAAVNPRGLPDPVWRKRKCRRLQNPFINEMHLNAARLLRNWGCHFDMWRGKQARHDGRGWVCPHRSVPLADHAAIDGVITCPLHLLRIDAATGTVLEPVKADRP